MHYTIYVAACGFWCVLAACASAVAQPPPAVHTVHVALAGDDRNDGSAGRPFKTLAQAMKAAGTGDTVRLAPGAYAGGVTTRVPGVTIEGPADAVVRGPARDRGIEVRHDQTVLRGFTVEGVDIGVWLEGVSRCVVDGLLVRNVDGEGLRIKNQSCDNVVRNCRFERMGRTGFDAAAGRKNGEGVYVGTAPEQRKKNGAPDRPDRCLRNLIEDCTFVTEAAEAVDLKEDSEENIVRRCRGADSRDPDGPVFGSRGDRNRFEACLATGGTGHGFRFGGDTVPQGKHGQEATRTYGANNVMRDCRAERNNKWGVAAMVRPQDIDGSNTFSGNGAGDLRP